MKAPAWLNDPTMYHNRGNSTFVGENALYGDFFGLDDLFTERPEVVQGMTDIYSTWISDVGIDGFRIDTVKHVNDEFWQAWAPAILQRAAAAGKPDFFMFGEVFDSNPAFTSRFTKEDKLQAVLDFPFQSRARSFASGGPTTGLQELFAQDDLYTDADSNAYSLPTFLGNHDMGRIGNFLRTDNPGASDAELLARDKLAHALMYLSRGEPVVYYGDEQGFTGDGGDKDARQDMFPSQVASYNDDDLIGTDATTAAVELRQTGTRSTGARRARARCGPSTARCATARRSTATRPQARASTPSRGSSATSRSSTSWRSTTPRRRSPCRYRRTRATPASRPSTAAVRRSRPTRAAGCR